MMSYGYFRVGAAIPELLVADCKYNSEKIIEQILAAEDKKVQIVAFPELSITSYTCADLFHQSQLYDEALLGLKNIAKATQSLSIAVIVGMPVKVMDKLFNCAVVLQRGRILAVIPKTYIPNKSEFYEKRWFSPAFASDCNFVNLLGISVPFGTDILIRSFELCFGVEICEDLWCPVPPSSLMAIKGANLIFNISASNELVGKNEYRRALVLQQSARCIAGYVYVSAGYGESTTDIVFASTAILAENGVNIANSQRFLRQPQLIVSEIDIELLNSERQKYTNFSEYTAIENSPVRFIDIDVSKYEITPDNREIYPFPFVPNTSGMIQERCEEIFSIQSAGLAKRLSHIGSKSVVIGISGGLDSTLALMVCVRAFDLLSIPRSNIIAVTMPGFGTTDRTYNNAGKLINKLGAHYVEIDIKAACIQHFNDIGHDINIHDTTYENTQARQRTQVLMNIATKHNAFVVGTGDLSELALGFATYNGDHMSMYAVNSGVPKTLVRYLIAYAADNYADEAAKKVLFDILDTPVSPELLPSDGAQMEQKTEEIVGPYELHDFFLYYMVRYGFAPGKILFLAELAFSGKYTKLEINKWLKEFYKRFFINQFKRSCMPDGPKVGSINLSPRGDWRMPSDASMRIWIDSLEG